MKQRRSPRMEHPRKTMGPPLSFTNSTCIARDASRRSNAPLATLKVL